MLSDVLLLCPRLRLPKRGAYQVNADGTLLPGKPLDRKGPLSAQFCPQCAILSAEFGFGSAQKLRR
jgi:hypothetical protein